MAKKSSSAEPLSKFQAVVAFFRKHPGASNDDAVDALKQQGFDISPRYVAQIRSKAKLRGSKSQNRAKREQAPSGRSAKKPASKPKKPPTTSQPIAPPEPGKSAIDTEAVVHAVHFIRSVGGVQRAKAALASAEQIVAALDQQAGEG